MKTLVLLILAISFIVSCESPQSLDNTKEQEQNQEQKPEKKEKKSAQRKMKDDDRVSGFFELKIDGQTYKSTQLQDNYCDMTYYYKGDESHVTIRLRDVDTYDAILLMFYGNKDFIEDPTGTIEDFMYSKANNKVNIQFLPGDSGGSIYSLTMLEGSINVSSFNKGQMEATFEGKGGTPQDVIKKKNLIPFEGKIKLTTENVKEMGETKDS